jgi:hypothetical protein
VRKKILIFGRKGTDVVIIVVADVVIVSMGVYQAAG